MDSPTNKRHLNHKQRVKQCWQYRIQGHSLLQIATLTGVSTAQAGRDVQEAYKVYQEQMEAEAIHFTKLTLAQTDELLKAVWNDASMGDKAAVNEARKLLEFRAKVLGLNAPAKAQIEVTTPESLEDLRNKIKTMLEDK